MFKDYRSEAERLVGRTDYKSVVEEHQSLVSAFAKKGLSIRVRVDLDTTAFFF
jgi:N-dimethylarginine dimethylaminohydrolase